MRPPRRKALRAAAGWLQGGLAALLGSTGAGTGASAGAGAGASTQDPDDPVRPNRALSFPRDHGAHPRSRIEWWYLTGWLQPGDQGPLSGFQITFFRIRTGFGEGLQGRFVPEHLLFAHAAVTQVAEGRHRHAQRIARWSGDESPGLLARARRADADVRIADWAMQRHGTASAGHWSARVSHHDFSLELRLEPTQPLLLQGQEGFSRKGPQLQQASHYYSLPQLAVSARLSLDAAPARALQGRAWMDHEWSDELLHPQAVGWDWVGLNLFDGTALTAFQLRRTEGQALWAGGSLRLPGRANVRNFAPQEVRLRPLASWRSEATAARYPVQWQVEYPGGSLRVRALVDKQEMDARSSTGTVYWEGLSEVLDAQGGRIGLGYLEMTGYAGRLRI